MSRASWSLLGLDYTKSTHIQPYGARYRGPSTSAARRQSSGRLAVEGHSANADRDQSRHGDQVQTHTHKPLALFAPWDLVSRCGPNAPVHRLGQAYLVRPSDFPRAAAGHGRDATMAFTVTTAAKGRRSAVRFSHALSRPECTSGNPPEHSTGAFVTARKHTPQTSQRS